MNALEIVNAPLQRQLRGLGVALRAGSPTRARRHAEHAIALVNEATDLALTADDLLVALAEGAQSGRTGPDVLQRLLETGVQRRLEDEGSRVVEDGETRVVRRSDDLRREVRSLLGVSDDSVLDRDPRWSQLLGAE